MTTLAELIPDPEAVLALEPEELSGVALELLSSSGPNKPSRLHPSSFTSSQTIGDYPGNRKEEIEFALIEGWQWLVQEGLISPDQESRMAGISSHVEGRRLRIVKGSLHIAVLLYCLADYYIPLS